MKKFLKTVFILLICIWIFAIYKYSFKVSNINMENTQINNQNFISNSYENQKFSIKADKKFYLYEDRYDVADEYKGMNLLEYDNTNSDYAEIYYIFYDYTTEPSFYYSLKITDEKNQNLLLNGSTEEIICGGAISSVKIRKLDFNNKINISVSENLTDTNEIQKSAEIVINLNQDLEKIEKIDQSYKLKIGKLHDANFEYIDHEYLYYGTTQHTYSNNLIGETYSIPVDFQYGNYLLLGGHIEFYCEKNVNNLNLDEVFESLSLINNNLGQYGLSDIYGLNLVGENDEIVDTIIVNFDEMINLCKGQSIEKDGKLYTKESFDGFAEMPMRKESIVNIGKNIDALKYSFIYDDENNYYMFIYKDYIYYIKFPKDIRMAEYAKNFLDSLEVNE